jgi:serine phosphatase RsbU (regulator of sigma subunit)
VASEVDDNGRVAAGGNLVDRLYRTLDEVPPDKMMPVIGTALAETIDATDVVLHLADYGEVTLERFGPERREASDGESSVPIDSSVPGACYRSQEVSVGPSEGEPGWTICAPVTVRAERFGVLEVTVPSAPAAEAGPIAAQVASALAYVVASARRYTDVFERVRRRRDLALAAEIQWELLPVLGYDAAEFRLAGSLEPAYDIGGDNFDYAIDGSRLTLSISDAMGHGLRAALCATLAVTAMRNSRRAGRDVVEQIHVANRALHEQFGGDMFVTMLALEFDIGTGRGTAVNAGHPPAWRHGPASVGSVELRADQPLGMFADSAYGPQTVDLVPGDRLVLLTDGILEAGPTRDEILGLERFAAMVEDHRGASPREFVRQVTRAVLAHRGSDLLDDATLLCLDWRGAPT